MFALTICVFLCQNLQLRYWFYLFMTALQDEDAQKRGFVHVKYFDAMAAETAATTFTTSTSTSLTRKTSGSHEEFVQNEKKHFRDAHGGNHPQRNRNGFGREHAGGGGHNAYHHQQRAAHMAGGDIGAPTDDQHEGLQGVLDGRLHLIDIQVSPEMMERGGGTMTKATASDAFHTVKITIDTASDRIICSWALSAFMVEP